MLKKISFSTKGQRADIAKNIIYRLLPNRYADAVGPFVFLDHIAPKIHSVDNELKDSATGAHPHRGIATLTYLLNGEAEHFDSKGHHAKVYSGGVQWMKAGNGIIHNENLSYDPNTTNRLTHGFQFWINLPAKNKAEAPQYMAIQSEKVPKLKLNPERGWIKIIVGTYENIKSPIPVYSKQFLFHLHVKPGKEFSLNTEINVEYAAFLPLSNATINETEFRAGEFIEFDREGGTIEIKNSNKEVIDILLFGGERYTEPIVADGPFVMNSHEEIAQAYRDLSSGKYGEIKYADLNN